MGCGSSKKNDDLKNQKNQVNQNQQQIRKPTNQNGTNNQQVQRRPEQVWEEIRPINPPYPEGNANLDTMIRVNDYQDGLQQPSNEMFPYEQEGVIKRVPKVRDENEKNVEEENLNDTFDSIDMDSKNKHSQYKKEFNKATPKFKGLPREYYPSTCKSVTISILMLFPAYIVCGLILWGLIEWGLANPISLGWVSFAIFMVYLVIIVIIVYIGSAEKKRFEREFIQKKIEDQKVQKENQIKEREEYREFLKKYSKKRTESMVLVQ